jgi:hypothetical protein
LAAGYFFDPESGSRRRHTARDRALALLRRGPATPAGDGKAMDDPAEKTVSK